MNWAAIDPQGAVISAHRFYAMAWIQCALRGGNCYVVRL